MFVQFLSKDIEEMEVEGDLVVEMNGEEEESEEERSGSQIELEEESLGEFYTYIRVFVVFFQLVLIGFLFQRWTTRIMSGVVASALTRCWIQRSSFRS